MTLAVAEKPLARRGTTNRNQRGSTLTRRRRREWLVATYRANVDVLVLRYPDLADSERLDKAIEDKGGYGYPDLDFLGYLDDGTGTALYVVPLGYGDPACRCYRCGDPLTVETVTVDRITPGCKKTAKYPKGGTYARENIRPACGGCNSETGGALASRPKKKVARG